MTDKNEIWLENWNINDIMNTIFDQGVVVIPEYLKTNELISLNEEFERIKRMEDKSYVKNIEYSQGIGKKVYLHKIPEGELTALQNIFSSHRMKSVSSRYFSEDHLINEEIFVVNDIVGSRHIANDLHFDVLQTLKFFLYLTDTDVSNGAFYCVPGSHLYAKKLRESKTVSFSNRDITRELPMEDKKEVPIVGPAGTLIIFDTDTFHRGGIVSKGERRVMRGHTRVKELKPNLLTRILSKIGFKQTF